ncbi:hypothetical protein D3C80_1319990 [compost metagenome]
MLGPFQVFELSAPIQPIADRKSDLAHRSLGVGHEAAEVATAHIGLDHHAPAAVLAADLVRSFRRLDAGDRRQGDDHPRARDDGQGGQGRRIIACVVGQTHDHVEATVALEDPPRLGAADGGRDRLRDIRGGQAVVGGREAIDADGQGRQTGGLLHPYIGRSRRGPQFGRDCFRRLLQGVEVVAIDHDGQVGPYARDQFVEP